MYWLRHPSPGREFPLADKSAETCECIFVVMHRCMCVCASYLHTQLQGGVKTMTQICWKAASDYSLSLTPYSTPWPLHWCSLAAQEWKYARACMLEEVREDLSALTAEVHHLQNQLGDQAVGENLSLHAPWCGESTYTHKSLGSTSVLLARINEYHLQPRSLQLHHHFFHVDMDMTECTWNWLEQILPNKAIAVISIYLETEDLEGSPKGRSWISFSQSLLKSSLLLLISATLPETPKRVLWGVMGCYGL